MIIDIDGTKIGQDQPPYIIAELSANHNGSIDRAFASIDAAKNCGANAIKLQTYSADTMTIDCDSPEFIIEGGLWDGYKLYDLYKSAETPFAWHKQIFDYAREKGITVFSTPFDESAVDLLEELNVPAYKIASFELIDIPLIKYVAKTGKPMIMSTGMASEAEISEAVSAARGAGCKELILLHCISSYPAPIEDTNLRQIVELGKRFNVISGLSDHTLGTTVSVAGVALGASVIEKHFTLSRKDKGPDSEFSIEPEELKRLCEDSKNAWLALGDVGFDRRPIEKGNILLRRSIYFVKDLPAGTIISETDIRRIRPGYGLPPKFFDEVLGRRLKVNVVRGTPLGWNHLHD